MLGTYQVTTQLAGSQVVLSFTELWVLEQTLSISQCHVYQLALVIEPLCFV
jgi:hypothetical protein